MRHPSTGLRLKGLVALTIAVITSSMSAQTTDPTFPVNGTFDKALVATVLEHATVHLDAETTLQDGTVVLHRGRIVAAGPSATTTFDGPAMRLDMTGLHVPLLRRCAQRPRHPKSKVRDGHAPQDLSDKKGA